MKDICIIGGGASGTAAAIAAARSGASVVIAEGNARVGKKLLTTGNGRCNLTHVSPSADAYRGDAEFIADVLGELGATGAFTFFKSLGLLLHSDGEGRVYPYSNSANTVLDALRRELDRLGVETVCGFRVKSVTGRDGDFSVRSDGDKTIKAKKIIFAAGGKAAPSSGSDGSGFALLGTLGIKSTETRPALTGLKCGGTARFKGIRAKARVTLLRGGEEISSAAGEVQFGDAGLSGICVFDVSRFAQKGDEAKVDLLPDYTPELAAQVLAELDGGRGLPAAELLCGVFNRRLAEYAAANAQGSGFAALAESAKSLRFTVEGVMPFANAQVTAGGVPASEVGRDLQSVRAPGVYIAGELLDVDGICGGYNLHWAWCSGIRAGESAASALKRL